MALSFMSLEGQWIDSKGYSQVFVCAYSVPIKAFKIAFSRFHGLQFLFSKYFPFLNITQYLLFKFFKGSVPFFIPVSAHSKHSTNTH